MVYHGHVPITHRECARNVSCGKRNSSHLTRVFTFITDGRQKKNGRSSWYGEPKIRSQVPVNLHNIIDQVSLMDETRFKPPGSELDEAKWRWCDGVRWMCSGNPHDNQNGSPCHKYLEVETTGLQTLHICKINIKI